MVKVAALPPSKGGHPGSPPPSLTWPRGGEEGPRGCSVRGSPGFPLGLPGTVGRGLIIGQREWKFQLSTWPPLTQPLGVTLLEAHGGGILGSPFSISWPVQVRRQLFSEWFGYCLKVSRLARLPVSWSLGWDSSFDWALSVPLGVSGFPVCPGGSLGCVGREDDPETSPPCGLFPWCPGLPQFCSALSPSRALTYILYIMPSAFRCTYEEQGRK